MPVNNLSRLILYFALYQATVGIFEAWDEAYEPSYLNSKNLSQTLIATSQSIAFLPWAFKMIFSFITDKFNFFGLGWRRPYCLIGLMISGTCFLVLTTFSPSDAFPLYVFVMVVRNCAIALADGATEGLSVDAGIEESSGAVQAWMMVGRMLGMMAGSAAGGPLAAISYQHCMVFLGIVTMAFSPINLLIKEERQRGESTDGSGAYAKVGLGLTDDSDAGAQSQVVNYNSTDDAAVPIGGAGLALSPSPGGGDGTGGLGSNASSEGGSYFAPNLDGSTGTPTAASGDALQPPPTDASAAGMPAAQGAVHAGEQLTEFQVLLGQLREVPVIFLVLFTFVTNLGTYVASFPIVIWTESKHEFNVEDVGWLTVASAVGNMCFSVPMGYLFDRVKNKQVLLYAASLLAGATYFTFPVADGKYTVFAAQALIAGGTGALYTVQCSMVRLVADERVGASMFGVVLGAMNLAAFLGTITGGPIADADMENCYWIGGITACIGVLFVPWIRVNTVYTPPVANLPADVMKPNELEGTLAQSLGVGAAGLPGADDGVTAGGGASGMDVGSVPLLVAGDAQAGELEARLYDRSGLLGSINRGLGLAPGSIQRTLRSMGLPVG